MKLILGSKKLFFIVMLFMFFGKQVFIFMRLIFKRLMMLVFLSKLGSSKIKNNILSFGQKLLAEKNKHIHKK